MPLQLRKAIPLLPFACVMAGALCWMLYVTWTQYASNHTYLSDVGIFNALCYGPIYGNWLRTPLAPDIAGNYFGIHFQPILLLLTPLYFVFNHVTTLLFVQTGALALAAIPWTLFVHALTQNRLIAFAAMVLYLCNHFVLSIHLANHPESIAIPFIMTLFYARETARWRLFFVALFVALCVKEDFSLFLFPWCVTIAMKKETRKQGIMAASACAIWAIMAHLIMRWCGAAEFERIGMTPVSRYASWGSTNGEILLHAIMNPVEVARRIVSRPLFILVISTGVLCVLDWRAVWIGVLAAAPFLATDEPIISRLDYYYAYAALPFFFFSTARGIQILHRKFPNNHAVIAYAITPIFLLLSAWSFFSPTQTDDLMDRPFPVSSHQSLTSEILKNIPRDAAVAAQFDLYTRVPHRKELFGLREANLPRVDYVALDLQGTAPDLLGDERKRVSDELSSANWESVMNLDGFVILKRTGARAQ
ncbi:hypothetical protein BH09SUM1_BH09SUM1_04890 [soil metagenome]